MSMRLAILKHWFSGHRNGESFISTVKAVTSFRCNIVAKRFIEYTKEDGSYRIIKIKGIKNLLYFPKSINVQSAYGVIVELLNKNHWHCYITKNTNIEKNDIVVDCGAAEGLFSLFVAEKCKKVYAIEPLPMFIDSMGKTFNGVDNVQILPYAVSDKQGRAFISQHSDGVSSRVVESDSNSMSIEIRTIDDLIGEKEVTFIKGDLEGYDFLTLLGARNTIIKNKPKIAITTYHNKEHASLITNYLKSIVPEYKVKIKGIHHRNGTPVMLHAWV